IRLGHLFELRAWICNRDKAAAGLISADHLFHALKEILLEDVRFERRARFARYDENCIGDVNLLLEGLHLRGIGGIQYEEFRESVDLSKSHPQDFRAQ